MLRCDCVQVHNFNNAFIRIEIALTHTHGRRLRHQHSASCSVYTMKWIFFVSRAKIVFIYFPFDLMCANNMVLRHKCDSAHSALRRVIFALFSVRLCFSIRLHFIFIYSIHLYYLLAIKLICNMFCCNFQHSHEHLRHGRYCIRMHFVYSLVE